ncbi:Gp138 family membrane-puncturing spike protein [Yersinia alsatica]|uniref:Gp138 family membrane-puncturing spike protein n=1 Tax=Yersinia alsatica TaxID=2890317 RepID=UPI00119F8A7F|nr:Gp138 family membrane-puncturing spike protein [Yersinia alsatica]
MTTNIQSTPNSSSSDINSLDFYISQFLNKIWTSSVVEVKGVSNSGELSPVGKVSIQPLVAQKDSSGRLVDHGIIHNVPYFRLQGGTDAVILDPKIGDIGVALFCNRDISAVKVSKKPSPPGSDRKFSPSDAIYMGVILNGTPSQFIRFSNDGIELISPTKVKITAPETEINSLSIILNGAVSQGAGTNSGDASFGGTITAVGEISGNGIPLSSHKHGGVQTGAGDTGSPVA